MFMSIIKLQTWYHIFLAYDYVAPTPAPCRVFVDFLKISLWISLASDTKAGLQRKTMILNSPFTNVESPLKSRASMPTVAHSTNETGNESTT